MSVKVCAPWYPWLNYIRSLNINKPGRLVQFPFLETLPFIGVSRLLPWVLPKAQRRTCSLPSMAEPSPDPQQTQGSCVEPVLPTDVPTFLLSSSPVSGMAALASSLCFLWWTRTAVHQPQDLSQR